MKRGPRARLHSSRCGTRRRPHVGTLVIAALVAAATSSLATAEPAFADEYTFTFTVDAGAGTGGIGVDAIYSGGGGGGEYDILPCDIPNDPRPWLEWDANGNLVGTRSIPRQTELGELVQVRFETYPLAPGDVCGQYTPWSDQRGGVHFEIDFREGNEPPFDLGRIVSPQPGGSGVFGAVGQITSATPITEGRVAIDSFQIPTGYPDPPAPLQSNGTLEWGTFASGSSVGDRWTAGLGWPGRYGIFITDRATGRKAHVLADLSAGNVPTIDLDAICFGFATCTFEGSVPNAPGAFNPVTPVRILDTRNRIGITNGGDFCQFIGPGLRCGVATGGGEESSPNPLTRRAVAANHTLKVTGSNGVPESGVSAVLLNVTAVDAPGPGYISVVPPGPRGAFGSLDLFDDQGWYNRRGVPSTSNLNVNGPGAVPNLVLARVGAGGTISFYNWLGPTEIVADLAGWFGTSGPGASGSGFIGLAAPQRVFDTRLGIGTAAAQMVNREVRSVDLRGVAGYSDSAEAAVVNLTVTSTTAAGFLSAFPAGLAPPAVSNLNFVPGDTRANLAVVPIRNGAIDLTLGDDAVLRADVVVDVMGWFAPEGGQITAIDPVRVFDSRTGVGTSPTPFGEGNIRTVAVGGVGGIPSDATGVVANVTGTGATAPYTFLTAWPRGTQPPTSNVNINLTTGSTVPNLVMIDLAPDATFQIANAFGGLDVIVDVMGYVR